MAKNPFQQLRVIRNASHAEKLIYDCYRLLYHPKLLNKSYDEVVKKAVVTKESAIKLKCFEVKKLIYSLRTENFRFNASTNHFDNQWMCYTLEICLREILMPRFAKNAFLQLNRQGISLLKNNNASFRWCLQLKLTEVITKKQSKILLKELSSFIKDSRFILLLHNYFYKMDQSKLDKLAKLLFSFYLTLLDKEIKRFDATIFFLRFHNEVMIFHQNKKHLNETLSYLKPFLKNSLKLQPNLVESNFIFLNKGIQIGNIILKWNNKSVKTMVSEQTMIKYARKYDYGDLEKFIATHRTYLVNKSEQEILAIYLNELNFIRVSTRYADNINAYKKLFYLAKQSYLKTLAFKKRKSVSKIYLYLKKNPRLNLTHLNLW